VPTWFDAINDVILDIYIVEGQEDAGKMGN
jgi:hypothetical protein